MSASARPGRTIEWAGLGGLELADKLEGMSRKVAFVVHPAKPEAVDAALEFAQGMSEKAIECLGLGQRAELVADKCANVQICRPEDLTNDVEVMVVFGGDGTILAAAEMAVPHGIPLLGVNLGHVGFLAELDPSNIPELIEQVISRHYDVEERLTLDVSVNDNGEELWHSFAVNEVTIEKHAKTKMLDLLIEVDGLPLYRFGCDGLLVSTPTGSTAYAFSLSGPVVWPDVEAFLVVPMAAHALFARPLVLAPDSQVDVCVADDTGSQLVLWCDGRRTVDMPPSAKINVKQNAKKMFVARLSEQPFTSRLVKKFKLNVEGFRH